MAGYIIPAEHAAMAGNFPPGTGYECVEITEFKDTGKLDKKGNSRYEVSLRFDNGGSTKVFGSLPYDEEGNLLPAVAAMSKKDQDAKIMGMVSAVKAICYSAGFTDEYMGENGVATDHLVGRSAYIAWLGRPDDTPQGVKAYGDVKDFITKAQYDKHIAAGDVPEDNRTFAWRDGGNATSSGGPTNPTNGAAASAPLPPPPPTGGARRGPLPPPPVRG